MIYPVISYNYHKSSPQWHTLGMRSRSHTMRLHTNQQFGNNTSLPKMLKTYALTLRISTYKKTTLWKRFDIHVLETKWRKKQNNHCPGISYQQYLHTTKHDKVNTISCPHLILTNRYVWCLWTSVYHVHWL